MTDTAAQPATPSPEDSFVAYVDPQAAPAATPAAETPPANAAESAAAQQPAAEAEETADDAANDDANTADDAANTASAPADGVKKPKKTAAERIAELTRQRHEAERALAAERAEKEALRVKLEGGKAPGLTEKTQGATSDQDLPPDPTDTTKYPYGELSIEYVNDSARYAVRQELKAAEAKQEEKRQREAAAQQEQTYRGKADAMTTAGAEKYDDFEDVVIGGMRAGTVPVSKDLAMLILDSDVGHDVAYHLASNPKEAQEVFGKTPLAQAAYFGRLEAKFSSTSSDAAAKPAVKTTQAPPPPATTARGTGSKTAFDPNTASFDDFEAKYGHRKK